VTGLPRSGATIVHNLLGFDKSFVTFDFSDFFNPLKLEEEKLGAVKKRLGKQFFAVFSAKLFFFYVLTFFV
jgi:hypothetical protein